MHLKEYSGRRDKVPDIYHWVLLPQEMNPQSSDESRIRTLDVITNPALLD